MMKKATIGFVAIGTVFAARPVLRRLGHKAREHCREMASQLAGSGEGADMSMGPEMRGRCKQMATRVEGREEAVSQV